MARIGSSDSTPWVLRGRHGGRVSRGGANAVATATPLQLVSPPARGGGTRALSVTSDGQRNGGS
ncbi:hypothetical protein E2562_019829 [Oryza meyeriana var. granulata]|uniref:Uncharacterized protein n=1 Tax=Oryza meyeriana var. granulata TaxID=110450 RepID=A0A6G1CS33_9ORYZ|nr:hypothetical protein E2562_019829 [Oryza meyeriana var. granulata]